MEQFDYVIVGAGSAGCAVAERLSRDASKRVLLLEAGGSDRYFWIKTPIGYGKTFHDPSVNWRYTTEPDPGLNMREIYWPRGKVLGGSSSINAMVYSHGVPGDYDDWEAAGNPGWGWSSVSETFRRLECRAGEDAIGKTGPYLWVEDRVREMHPVRRYFADAAREIGLPEASDVNGDTPEGFGAYQFTTHRGRRFSAADAFLRPALKRRNLVLRTGVSIRRVDVAEGRVTGVSYRDAGGTDTSVQAGETILCAGAIGTPLILQASGIGPGGLLQDRGIRVRMENAAIGANLQDHLGISYFYRASEPTLNHVLGTWAGRISIGLRYLLFRTGPMSLSVNQMGGIVRSDPEKEHPDLQLYFNPISYSVEKKGKREIFQPDPYPGFIMGFNSCRPTSHGKVSIAASGDPTDAPKIEPNYLSTDKDRRDAVAGGRLIARLSASEAMREFIVGTPKADPNQMSDQEILADFRARSSTVFHACGTCRMAPREDGGVVDPRLRLYGLDGIRIADASVFPNITSANTNAPAILVGVKAGDIIAGNSV